MVIKTKLNCIDGQIVTEPFPIVLDVTDGGIDVPVIIFDAEIVIKIFRLDGPVRIQHPF